MRTPAVPVSRASRVTPLARFTRSLVPARWAYGLAVGLSGLGALVPAEGLAQESASDPDQPYLTPAPGTGSGTTTAPSRVFRADPNADSEADLYGTDQRSETLVSPEQSTGSNQAVTPDARPLDHSMPPMPAPPSPEPQRPAVKPQTAIYRPPPRPVPARQPSGRSAWVPPTFAVQVDPLEFLLEGRFGPHVEIPVLTDYLTLEFTPLFVTSSEPLSLGRVTALNFRDGAILQESAGIGPLAGLALGVGLWLSGEAFRGHVIRAQITNYGIEYLSNYEESIMDSAVFVERRLSLTFGTAYRWGPVMLEAAGGLSYELNTVARCVERNTSNGDVRVGDVGCGREFQLATTPTTSGDPVNVFAGMHPLAITGRLTIGIAID